MTVQTKTITDWQKIKPKGGEGCSPNLRLIVEYLIAKHGGSNIGCYGAMPKDATYIRSHYHGSAVDYRYDKPGPGVTKGQTIILPWLIDNSQELGVQAIHDYYNCRIWRARRTDNTAHAHTEWWKLQKPDGKMGARWATYFHIETNRDQWNVTVPIDLRFNKPVEQQIMKPTLKIGSTGDYVRWLQQRLLNNGYSGVAVSGTFDDNTRLNVIWFQTVYGLQPDGIVGAKTWAAIDSLPPGVQPG